jgi:hypothetical protein
MAAAEAWPQSFRLTLGERSGAQGLAARGRVRPAEDSPMLARALSLGAPLPPLPLSPPLPTHSPPPDKTCWPGPSKVVRRFGYVSFGPSTTPERNSPYQLTKLRVGLAGRGPLSGKGRAGRPASWVRASPACCLRSCSRPAAPPPTPPLLHTRPAASQVRWKKARLPALKLWMSGDSRALLNKADFDKGVYLCLSLQGAARGRGGA